MLIFLSELQLKFSRETENIARVFRDISGVEQLQVSSVDDAFSIVGAIIWIVVSKIKRARDDEVFFDNCKKFCILGSTVRSPSIALTRYTGWISKLAASLFPECAMKKDGATESSPNFMDEKAILIHNDLKEFGPGELRMLGPRHDNDFKDYKKISILPTEAEIFATDDNYLPVEGYSSFIETPVLSLLDSQFRLLREDLVLPWKAGLNLLRTALKNKLIRFDQSVYPKKRADVRMLLKRNCQPYRIQHDGSNCLCIWFKVGSNRNNFNHGKGCFSYNSMVCVIAQLNEGINLEFQFGKIRQPNFKMLENNNNGIKVHNAGREMLCIFFEDHNVVKYFEKFQECYRNKGEIIVAQVEGGFFQGFESVLKSLQFQSPSMFPFVETFCNFDGLDGIGDFPPSYLKNMENLDFSSLCSKGVEECASITAQELQSYDVLLARLVFMARKYNFTVTGKQLEAIALAVSRRVVLIQGPPGTADMLPIVCICFTNHALDDFMLDLIDSGIPKSKVIRVGNRGSDKLINLSDSIRSVPTSFLERNERRTRQRKRENLFSSLNQTSTIFSKLSSRKNEVSLQVVAKHIEKKFPSLAVFFFCNDLIQTILVDLEKKGEETLMNFKLTPANQRYLVLFELGAIKIPHFSKTELSLLEKVNRLDNWLAGFFKYPDRESSFGCKTLLENNGNPWILSKKNRLSLFNYLKQSIYEQCSSRIESQAKEYEVCRERENAFYFHKKLAALKAAQVVGFTSVGAANNLDLLKELKPKIVIYEEAGEVLEAHVMATLTRNLEHLILIGDHLQLPPKVQNYSLSRESASPYKLDVSLFERLVNLATKHKNSTQFVTLERQRRMRPEISCFIRKCLYPNLVDDDIVLNRGDIPGFRDHVVFLDHDNPESTEKNSSKRNDFEAKFVTLLARYAVSNEISARNVVILTPYLGQVVHIKKYLNSYYPNLRVELSEKDKIALDFELKVDNSKHQAGNENSHVFLKDCLRVSSVDNYQGEEADLVIISTVRNNSNGNIGFLKSSHRVNVMCSRARSGMIILGSVATIQKSKGDTVFKKIVTMFQNQGKVFRSLALKCQQHGTVSKVSTPSELEGIAVDGGCSLSCQDRLPCGHACTRKCHPGDREHAEMQCVEPCERVIPKCGHPCPRFCYQECGMCEEDIKETLPCGHEIQVKCSQQGTKTCTFIYNEFKLPHCEHSMEVTCPESQKLRKLLAKESSVNSRYLGFKCQSRCGSLNKCGHICENSCGDCLFKSWKSTGQLKVSQHMSCKYKCKEAFDCGHQCSGICHQPGECKPCQAKCATSCSHSFCARKCFQQCPVCAQACDWKCTCGDQDNFCKLCCGLPCFRLPCNARCKKKLSCGHQCLQLCGEDCNDDACVLCFPRARVVVKNNRKADEIVRRKLSECVNTNLITLDCKHVFTVEKLDQFIRFDEFYETEQDSSELIHFCSLKHGFRVLVNEKFSRFKCPVCRKSFNNVRRYRRIIRLYEIVINVKKFVFQATALLQALTELAQDMHDYVRLPEKTVDKENKEVYKLIKKSEKKLKLLKDLVLNQTLNKVIKKKSVRQVYKNTRHCFSLAGEDLEFLSKIPFIVTVETDYRLVSLNIKCLIRTLRFRLQKKLSKESIEGFSNGLKIAQDKVQEICDSDHKLPLLRQIRCALLLKVDIGWYCLKTLCERSNENPAVQPLLLSHAEKSRRDSIKLEQCFPRQFSLNREETDQLRRIVHLAEKVR
eukprot:augustus_masked-scaffold_7-processed-gene-18.6-mRNA-1 protein AED:0.40 eAED:0.40 QI:0/0/0/0.5/1/1/2/0/1721